MYQESHVAPVHSHAARQKGNTNAIALTYMDMASMQQPFTISQCFHQKKQVERYFDHTPDHTHLNNRIIHHLAIVNTGFYQV